MASGSEEDPLGLSELLSNTVPISLRLPDRLIFLNSYFTVMINQVYLSLKMLG